jgi:hypothetical protein
MTLLLIMLALIALAMLCSPEVPHTRDTAAVSIADSAHRLTSRASEKPRDDGPIIRKPGVRLRA